MGSTSPSVSSAARSASSSASSSSGPTASERPRARVHARELRVGPEAAAGAVDRVELALDGRPRAASAAGSRDAQHRRAVPSACQLRGGEALAGVRGARWHRHLTSRPRRPGRRIRGAGSVRGFLARAPGRFLGGRRFLGRLGFLRRSRGFLRGRGFLGRRGFLRDSLSGVPIPARTRFAGGLRRLVRAAASGGPLGVGLEERAAARRPLRACRGAPSCRLAREGVRGDLGEDAGEHDAAGDQPAVDAAQLDEGGVAGVGGVVCASVGPQWSPWKSAAAVQPGAEFGITRTASTTPADQRARERERASGAPGHVARRAAPGGRSPRAARRQPRQVGEHVQGGERAARR